MTGRELVLLDTGKREVRLATGGGDIFLRGILDFAGSDGVDLPDEESEGGREASRLKTGIRDMGGGVDWFLKCGNDMGVLVCNRKCPTSAISPIVTSESNRMFCTGLPPLISLTTSNPSSKVKESSCVRPRPQAPITLSPPNAKGWLFTLFPRL